MQKYNTTKNTAKKKVMFIHNAVPEYRVEFWKEMQRYVVLELLITNGKLADEIYGLNKNLKGLKISYWNDETFLKLKENISKYESIVLPPADTIKEWIIGLKVVNLCKKKCVKSVFWTERWEDKWKNQTFIKKIKYLVCRFMIASLAHLSDQCIASGSQVEKFLCQLKVSKDKIAIAYDSSTSPESIEIIDFKSKYEIPDDAKIVLYFGRVIERKGLLLLIKAVKELKITNCWLMVCGTGDSYLDLCKKYVDDNRIPNICFTGKIQPGLRKQYYKRANVFCLPSYPINGVVEVWGLSVNEALECGTPVIATNAVGAAYDLINDNTGVMISTENQVEELKKALLNIFKLGDVSKECVEVSKEFSVEKMAEEFCKACC